MTTPRLATAPATLTLLAALGLAACGGGTVEPGPPVDVRLDQASRAGNDALSL
jgi:hypothetical protein